MSGGASKKQTNINFTPMSDDTSQEPRSDAETSDKDRAKRSRYEMENNDENNVTPDTALFFGLSVVTNKI